MSEFVTSLSWSTVGGWNFREAPEPTWDPPLGRATSFCPPGANCRQSSQSDLSHTLTFIHHQFVSSVIYLINKTFLFCSFWLHLTSNPWLTLYPRIWIPSNHSQNHSVPHLPALLPSYSFWRPRISGQPFQATLLPWILVTPPLNTLFLLLQCDCYLPSSSLHLRPRSLALVLHFPSHVSQATPRQALSYYFCPRHVSKVAPESTFSTDHSVLWHSQVFV